MSPSASSLGLIEALVHACRVRISSQVRKRECFLALTALLLGICCLLFLGTRYVPVAALPLAAAFGAWLAIRRWRIGVPGSYDIAQRIDVDAGLSDELSTAYYFRAEGSGAFSKRIADSLYERASGPASEVRPEQVFPSASPATQRASIYLVASAALLFGLRASVQSKLSFEPPLAPLLIESWFGHEPRTQLTNRLQAAQIDTEQSSFARPPETELPDKPTAESESTDQALPEEQFQDPSGLSNELPEVEGLITVPLDDQGTEDSVQESSALAEDGTSADDGADSEPGPSEDGWDEDSQSLMDKLKHAFENMLQTLDMASIESADSDAGQEQGSGSTEESASAGEPNESGDSGEEVSTEAAAASMEGGEPGQEASETASAGSTSGEDSSGEQSSGEQASAAGSSDGSKEFVEAEQMEVLGALEELYMERAEGMKGDVTIETRLAEQSANVPYNERSVAHADGGGAISRDEIPAAYRTYIRNYFEALRRNTE